MHKTRLDNLPTKRITDTKFAMVFPCTNERPTALFPLTRTRTNESLPHQQRFVLAIDILLSTRLLVFSNRDFGHYFVPARRDELIAVTHSLRDPLCAGVFGQTVTAVFRTVDLIHCYPPSGDLVLDP